MVYGKDATRGHYRLPPEEKVNHRRLGNGHKLKAGRKDRERKPQSIGELVGGPIRANKESSGASTWLPKKVREWLEVLDMVAIARGKEARRACQMCSK